MTDQRKIQVNQIGNFYILNSGGGIIEDNTLTENGLIINKTNAGSTAAALLINQDATGPALQIVNSGSGYDISAGNDTFLVTNAGHILGASLFLYNAGGIPFIRLQDNIIFDLKINQTENTVDLIANSSGFTTRLINSIPGEEHNLFVSGSLFANNITFESLGLDPFEITPNPSELEFIASAGVLVPEFTFKGSSLAELNLIGQLNIQNLAETQNFSLRYSALLAGIGSNPGLALVGSSSPYVLYFHNGTISSTVPTEAILADSTTPNAGAELIGYDNTKGSGSIITASIVQDALDELEEAVENVENELDTKNIFNSIESFQFFASGSSSAALIISGLGVHIPGKLTVDGIIDPTGLVFENQAAAPTTVSSGNSLLWVDSNNVLRLTSDSGDINISPELPHLDGGRLTTIDTNPAGGTTSGFLHFVPYLGNKISLYTGSRWEIFTIPDQGSPEQLTIEAATFPTSSNTNYDIFLTVSGGDLVLDLEAWSGNTTRGFTVSRLDGVYVLATDQTKRYLGTVRTTSANTFSDTTQTQFVWNQTNRIIRASFSNDTTGSWSPSGSVSAINSGNAAWKHEYVVGFPEDYIEATAQYMADGTPTVDIGLGYSSTSAYDTNCAIGRKLVNLNNGITIVTNLKRTVASSGYFFIQGLEQSSGGSAFGGTSPKRAGMFSMLRM